MANTRLAFLSVGRWPCCRPSLTPRARAAAKPDLMRWTAPHKASKCRRVIVADGRDGNRPRLAVGEGFPFPLFRLRDGFTVSPWRTFAEAPLKFRTARFPGSGFKPWRVTIGLPKAWRGLNAGWYPPHHSWFAYSLTSLSRHLRMCRFYQAGRLDAREGRQVSRAPLPNSGITSVGETWTVSWEGVTPPSSLVLAHAPLPLGSLLLRFLVSLESPCRLLPVPAAHGSFPTLFPRTFPWMLDPLPRRYTVCSHLFLPRCHRPSPSD